MAMAARMVRKSGVAGYAWCVVDEKGRIIIEDETYGVASAVCHAYNNPMHWQPTEAYEIADAHHAARRQWKEE